MSLEDCHRLAMGGHTEWPRLRGHGRLRHAGGVEPTPLRRRRRAARRPAGPPADLKSPDDPTPDADPAPNADQAPNAAAPAQPTPDVAVPGPPAPVHPGPDTAHA